MRHIETTHAVTNQPPALEDYDVYGRDRALVDAVAREGGSCAHARLADYGRFVGSAAAQALGSDANRSPPELRSHDRYGHRIDAVAYHPAYHALMQQAMEHEVHSVAWRGAEGGQVAHAALLYLHTQVEAGTCCPLTMTHAAQPVLRIEPTIASTWATRASAARYDASDQPIGAKQSATIGMAMTEKQGGSDVRANSTEAARSAGAVRASLTP